MKASQPPATGGEGPIEPLARPIQFERCSGTWRLVVLDRDTATNPMTWATPADLAAAGFVPAAQAQHLQEAAELLRALVPSPSASGRDDVKRWFDRDQPIPVAPMASGGSAESYDPNRRYYEEREHYRAERDALQRDVDRLTAELRGAQEATRAFAQANELAHAREAKLERRVGELEHCARCGDKSDMRVCGPCCGAMMREERHAPTATPEAPELNHLDQLCVDPACDQPRNESGYCAEHEPTTEAPPFLDRCPLCRKSILNPSEYASCAHWHHGAEAQTAAGQGERPETSIAPDDQLPCRMCGAADHTARGHFPPGYFRRLSNQLRLCPGCRSLDGEHNHKPGSCTLVESTGETQPAAGQCPSCAGVGRQQAGGECLACDGTGRAVVVAQTAAGQGERCCCPNNSTVPSPNHSRTCPLWRTVTCLAVPEPSAQAEKDQPPARAESDDNDNRHNDRSAATRAEQREAGDPGLGGGTADSPRDDRRAEGGTQEPRASAGHHEAGGSATLGRRSDDGRVGAGDQPPAFRVGQRVLMVRTARGPVKDPWLGSVLDRTVWLYAHEEFVQFDNRGRLIVARGHLEPIDPTPTAPATAGEKRAGEYGPDYVTREELIEALSTSDSEALGYVIDYLRSKGQRDG